MENLTIKMENDDENLPEVIYVQYDGDDLESLQRKLANGNILLQVRDTQFESSTNKIKSELLENEYHDIPELISVEDKSPEDTGRRTAVKNESTQKDEVCSAVSSIENVTEEDFKYFPTPLLVELDEIEGDNSILMYACKNMDENPINKYPCEHCDLVLGCIFCLKSHYESVHLKIGVLQYQCTQIMNNINQADVCPKCRLICINKLDMLEHRKVHFVTCEVCDMSFDSALYLSNHCKNNHDNFEVVLTCDLCSESFRKLLDLSDHYQNKHFMNLCIVCLKRFTTVDELEVHHKTHKIVLMTETPMPYACSKCDMTFNTITDLSKHLNLVHSKNKKKLLTTSEQNGSDFNGSSECVQMAQPKKRKVGSAKSSVKESQVDVTGSTVVVTKKADVTDSTVVVVKIDENVEFENL